MNKFDKENGGLSTDNSNKNKDNIVDKIDVMSIKGFNSEKNEISMQMNFRN